MSLTRLYTLLKRQSITSIWVCFHEGRVIITKLITIKIRFTVVFPKLY